MIWSSGLQTWFTRWDSNANLNLWICMEMQLFMKMLNTPAVSWFLHSNRLACLYTVGGNMCNANSHTQRTSFKLCLYRGMPSDTNTHACSRWFTFLSLSVCCSAASLSLALASWMPALVGRKRCVDNCLPLTCHQTTLSHFTAGLILRHRCQKMTFHFQTSSICYSFFVERTAAWL